MNFIFLRFAIALIGVAATARAAADESGPQGRADCAIPFTKMQDPRNGNQPFQAKDVYINRSDVSPVYRMRYVVVNLNSVGDDGLCKGVQESYPAPDDLSNYPDLADARLRQNFEESVQHRYARPVTRPRALRYGGRLLCAGQAISLCELRPNANGGYVPVQVAHLVTSGAEGAPPHTYYAPLNVILTRSWEVKGHRPYTPLDDYRDRAMGGVDDEKHWPSGWRVVAFRGVAAMPNFMNFVPGSGFRGETQNGIHQRVSSEGPGTEADLGVPSSLGCLRVTNYGSRLARWYTPMGAAVFIHYDVNKYRRFSADASGRPR